MCESVTVNATWPLALLAPLAGEIERPLPVTLPASVTALPLTGLPNASSSVTVTVDVPPEVEVGLATTVDTLDETAAGVILKVLLVAPVRPLLEAASV